MHKNIRGILAQGDKVSSGALTFTWVLSIISSQSEVPGSDLTAEILSHARGAKMLFSSR